MLDLTMGFVQRDKIFLDSFLTCLQFNFNEAVNFALPDWLSLGRDCVQRYKEHRKLPVFSHDELLVTITQQSQSIKTSMWCVSPYFSASLFFKLVSQVD
jgi:hypothetical protein